MTPVPGEVPDFHRIESFAPIQNHPTRTRPRRGGPIKDGSPSR
jgi:hypothetical protein